MASKTNIMVARVSGLVILDGKKHRIHRGRTTAHSNHPIVRGSEDKWRSLTVDYSTEEREPALEKPDTRKPQPEPKAPAKKAAPKKAEVEAKESEKSPEE